VSRARHYDKVSIAGHVGSGKSTVGGIVVDRTGWRLVSTGALFRAIAERRGMSVLELNRYAETDPTIDDEVDGHLRALAGSDEPVVIDSRMAFHFVPTSLKVFLVVDPIVGAQRVQKASRRDEHYRSLDEAAEAGRARQRVESERYHRLYGVRRDDWGNYDLVIDTTHASAEEVASIVLDVLDHPAGRSEAGPECLLSPRRLVPTVPRSGAPADAVVAVAVSEETAFIVGGHDAVSLAVDAADPLIRCRLVAYEPPTEEALPGIGAPLRTAVSAAVLTEWERRHGLRFDGLPSWVAGATNG
jgi:CMP/dCMP kinase